MSTLRDIDWQAACGTAAGGERHGRALLLPDDAAAAARCLRHAAQHGLRLRPVSGLREPHGLDLPDAYLSLERLRGIVDWHPHEGTITALAGTPMAELERAAERDGWRVLPQSPDPSGSSLGGVVSAGASGLERARHGPLRHHLLGARLALPDGTIARSGSRLVKNVTGYDLHRAACGARGTLGVVVEASLRLVPLPRAAWSLHLEAQSFGAAFAAADALRAARVELDLLRSRPVAGGWSLVAWGSGRPETCATMLAAAARAVPAARCEAPRPWAECVAAWNALREEEAQAQAALEIGCLPASCADVSASLLSSGLDIFLVDHPLARILARAPDQPAPAVRRALRARPQSAAGIRVRSTHPRLAASVVEALDPTASALESRLRAALDPHGVLSRQEAP